MVYGLNAQHIKTRYFHVFCGKTIEKTKNSKKYSIYGRISINGLNRYPFVRFFEKLCVDRVIYHYYLSINRYVLG